MSWGDFFPLMDEGMVEAFMAEASEEEKEGVQEMFATEAIYGERGKLGRVRVVSTSLFWKPEVDVEGDFPVPCREVMENPAKHGLRTRFGNPWQHYVEPLFEAAGRLRKGKSEATLRVYLANDLRFLVSDLLEAGCEVHLMKSSSLKHNPGAMWRFLAMEDAEEVTVTDSDLVKEVVHDVLRTKLMVEGGLRFWRIPYYPGSEKKGFGSPAAYRTMIAGKFGAAVKLPMRLLVEAFLWNVWRGRMRDYWTVGERRIPIFKAKWPNYGFDEFFLNAVVYPRVVSEGVLTLVPWNQRSYNYWFALDIEHCTRANPEAEMIFVGDPKVDQVLSFEWSEEEVSEIVNRLRGGGGNDAKDPILSICVTVKNRSRISWKSGELCPFPKCVKALASVAEVVGSIELVVADFSSDDWPLVDWLAEVAGTMEVKVLGMAGPFSKGRGLNEAVGAAKSENLLLFDADILIDESAFVAGLHFLSKGKAFFPILMNLDESGNDEIWNHWGTGIVFVKKKFFKAAGGIPEFQSWGGEDDLFYQAVCDLAPVERSRMLGIVHQWHPEFCRHENYEKGEREDFRTYVGKSESRANYHSLERREGMGSYRVFHGNHPEWAGSVRFGRGKGFARPGIEGGKYELFEEEELKLDWDEKEVDSLRWDGERGLYSNGARDFTMREVVRVDASVKKPLRVAYEGMWNPFDIDQLNAGFRMLPFYFLESHLPDLIICGPWCDPEKVSRKWPGVKTLFFTGENVAPASWSDFNIGFHRDIEDESYLRWPLFLFYFYWKFDGAGTLLKKDMKGWQERPGFMSFVARNSSCETRNDFARLLMEEHKVDCPGETLNNMPPIGPDGIDKQRFLSKYRYNLCFENNGTSGSEGYVTEKIAEAMRANCVPVYWGDHRVGEDFNEASFINLTGCEGPGEMREVFLGKATDVKEMSRIIKEPWFVGNQVPDQFQEERIISFFERVVR